MQKNKITAILVMIMFALTMVAPAVYANNISDVTGHWAEAQIKQMVGQGIISGYPDGSFKPDGKITRAEFASLIVKGFNLSVSGGKVFTDTKGHWAQEFIATANAYGIVNGYNDTTFAPDDSITREQMAVMVVKAAKLTDSSNSKTFADSTSIADWAKSAVAIATSNNIISGYPDNTFKPSGNATRAEAVVVLHKSINLVPITPPVIDEPVKPDYSVIEKAGTYGPKTGTETVPGNVTIKAKDTTLQNLIIKGDLIIAKEVGNGDVTLNNIKVEGKTYIRGGGKDSIHINGGQYKDIIVESTATGAVRIVAIDAQGIKVIISENAKGEEIILSGEFKNITVKADDVNIISEARTKIDELKVQSDLKNVTINLAKGSTVKEMVLDSKASVKGEGTIKEASGKEAKNSSFQTAPDKIISSSGGGGGGGGSSTVAVSAISVAPKSVELTVGATQQLTATVEPDNATNKTITWSTSDANIATVSNTGLITAVADGEATITAKAGDKTAAVAVTVVEENLPTKMTYVKVNEDRNSWDFELFEYKGVTEEGYFIKGIIPGINAEDFILLKDFGTEKVSSVSGFTVEAHEYYGFGDYLILTLPEGQVFEYGVKYRLGFNRAGYKSAYIDAIVDETITPKVIEGIGVVARTSSTNGDKITVGTVTGSDKEFAVAITGLDGMATITGNPGGIATEGKWFGLQLLPTGVTDITKLAYKTAIQTEFATLTAVDATEAGEDGQIVWWINGDADVSQDIWLKYADEADETAIKLTINYTAYVALVTQYTLTLTGEGLTSTPEAGAIEEGTEVTVTVAPAAGKQVATFTVGGVDKKADLVANAYTFTITANTEVAVTYEAIPPAYASTNALANATVSVANGTSEADAKSALDATVEVVGTKGETGIATIAWIIASYDGAVAGNYTATGVLTLPADWTGTAANVTATVTVEAAPEPVTYTVIFNSNGGCEVSAITVEEGKTVTLPAEPTRDGYTFVGWFTDDNTFENAFTAETRVTEDITVYAKWEVVPVTTYIVTFTVTPEDATVVVKDSENNEVAAETDGTYKLAIGTYSYIVSAEGYVEKTGELTVNNADQTVTVTLEKVVVNPTIVSVTNVADVEVDYGTGDADAIAELAETTTITDSNDATHTVNLSWTIAEYDGNTAGTYTATGTFELPEGVDQAEPAIDLVVTATVTVKAEVVADKEITAVTAIDDITVAYGTELSAAGLPETVEVTLDDETTTTLAVTWDGGNPEYNGNTAGTYVFKGTLTLVEGVANTANITATVNVTVAEQEQTALPTITTEAQTVNTLTITIEGTAEANAVITITGGAKESTGTADENGSFSIEVALTSDAVNNLSVTAEVAGKTVSEAATVVITHETVEEASIENVVATNGKVTITLEVKPTVAPIETDFIATIAIDSGSAEALALTDFIYDNNLTVSYNFTPIAQTAETQSVLVAVKLGEGEFVTATAFTVEAKLIEYASTETVDFGVTVNFGTSEADAKAALAKEVSVTGSEGGTGIATITWAIAGYNGSEAGDYTATGVLTLPEGWTGTPTDVTATVTVEEDPVKVALAAVNTYLTEGTYVYADAPGALESHLTTLGLQVGAESDYAKLDKTADGGKNRKTAVFYDLNNNKPGDGYDQGKLTTYFNDMVATRLVTEESMDLLNGAENTEALNGISFMTKLLERFRLVSYGTHSDIPVAEKISTLEGLVTRYNGLSSDADRDAVLQKLLDKRPEGGYARSQATTDALADALTEVEEGAAAIEAALSAVNDYLTEGTYVYADALGALESHLTTLGLQVGAESDYAKLDKTADGGKNRKTAVFYDLNNNKPGDGYDQGKLTTYFNDMVATRLVTEESMDKVNKATTVADLEGISWVENLLTQFETVSYGTHSDIPIADKVSTLQNLVTRYGNLDADGQLAVLQKVFEGKPYARSQATTDALAVALTEVEEGAAINERLAITSVTIADKGAYDSTAKGTVRVLGYGVGINLDAKSEGKKISDTTSIVVELFKGETKLGQQSFNASGYANHGEKSSTSGTIDAGGQYVATSWDNSWSAGIAEIPNKAVAKVQYTDGIAAAELTLNFTEEQTKIFFAAGAVHALFEDVFAETLVLADGVTQDAITAASVLVEAVTLNPTQNKAALQGLITEAQALLGADQEAINARLAITSISVADDKDYASSAAAGGTVQKLGYGVVINLNADGSGKKVSDTTSVVIELYNGDTLIGQQTLNDAGRDKTKDNSVISGTIDVAGEYVATSWDHEWTGKITDIPDKAVAIVKYSDGTATVEKTVSLSDDATAIFFAAEAVYALFENVFAEPLVLAADVTEENINAALGLVEAVTVKPDENKAVLQGLITEAQALLVADQDAPEGLVGVAPTAALNDGKITGTTTAMEYKLASAEDTEYVACGEGETTGLAAGDYVVRLAAKEGFNAGTAAEVTVPAYVAPTYTVTLGTITRVSGDDESTVTINASPVAAGTTVYLTVEPKVGMQLKAGTLKAKYNDGEGKEVTIAGSAPNYQFTMPAYPVEVTAEFMIPDAILISVASETDSNPLGGTGASVFSKIEWKINVPNSKSTLSASDIAVSEDANFYMYNEQEMNTSITEKDLIVGESNVVYIKVLSYNTTMYYAVTINRSAE